MGATKVIFDTDIGTDVDDGAGWYQLKAFPHQEEACRRRVSGERAVRVRTLP